MLAIERKQRLLAILRDRKTATLDALASELGVSGSTVRRDLEALEQSGDVERTHGGVVFTGDKHNGRPYAFDSRLHYATDAKRRIAKAARQLVTPGQTILIDGGTTTLYFAEELRGMHLQIVTNSLPIAELYQNDDNVELILTGGLAYPRYGVLLGPIAEQLITTIHTQTLFLSVAGVHGGWLYNQNLLLVQAEEKMIRQSQQVVLLVDQSKFGQQALSKLCELKQVHTIVTDAEPPDADRKQIERAGCKLIVAE
jgi:DeoR family transcriptional regulator, fructose operon transcriptional repressor